MRRSRFAVLAAGVAGALFLSFCLARGVYSASDGKSLEALKAEPLPAAEAQPLREAVKVFHKERRIRLAKALQAAAAADQDRGPANPTLDYNGKGFKVVNFPHHDHQNRAGGCMTCHHADKPEARPRACRTCHDGEAQGRRPQIKDAYHARCIGCHKEVKKGPTACMDCHGRK